MCDARRWWLAMAVLALSGAVASAVEAQESQWAFEITPYLWATSLDGDVTVGDRKASVDVSASDLLDAADMGGSLLASWRINRFVLWGQVDYLSLDTDELDNAPARGRLESDVLVYTLGLGYMFGNPEARSLEVLLGARELSLDNTLALDGIGVFERDKDFIDPVLILRPSWRLSKRWRFNPTLSYGTGGDSESTYELQPQFQFQMSRSVAARFGFRRLYYDTEADNGRTKWDGSFDGPFIGIGGTFGSRRE